MATHKRKIIRPRSVRLEASTACQLKCPTCPTALGETGKYLGTGFLKFNDFKTIVDKNPWIVKIELSNWGEIFLNPDLADIMRYAHKHKVALHADNGVNLNNVAPEVLDAVVRYRFRSLSCSIDGASQKTYSVYRVQGNFDQVIDNIKSINAFKERYQTRFPLLRWQFVAFGHNEHEIPLARKMAADLNMSFFVKLSWEDLYTAESFSPVQNTARIREETGLGVASRGEYREKYKQEYIEACCLAIWNDPQVHYDGRVLAARLIIGGIMAMLLRTD